MAVELDPPPVAAAHELVVADHFVGERHGLCAVEAWGVVVWWHEQVTPAGLVYFGEHRCFSLLSNRCAVVVGVSGDKKDCPGFIWRCTRRNIARLSFRNPWQNTISSGLS